MGGISFTNSKKAQKRMDKIDGKTREVYKKELSDIYLEFYH